LCVRRLEILGATRWMVNSRKYLSDTLSLSLAHSFSCRPRILAVRLTLAIFPYHCPPTRATRRSPVTRTELIEIDVVAIINEQARGVRTAKVILYARTSVPPLEYAPPFGRRPSALVAPPDCSHRTGLSNGRTCLFVYQSTVIQSVVALSTGSRLFGRRNVHCRLNVIIIGMHLSGSRTIFFNLLYKQFLFRKLLVPWKNKRIF